MNFLEEEKSEPTVNNHSIWAEKYRPSKLEDYVGNETLKAKVKQYIETNDIPHLLLYGSAGTGKTTLAKLITNSIKCDMLYINASDENGIDTIRVKIKNFACNIGFNPLKVIVLDECLDENTRVWVLRDGKEQPIFIKNLDDKNDLVKSYNTKTEQVEWMPFILFDKGTQEVYKISLENGEVVICTPDHKWYVEENGLKKVVKASDLHKYNHILSP
jgi:type IV secretory pathway VirB4 component